MKLIHLILPLPFLAACNSGFDRTTAPDSWSVMRERMVRTQIEHRGITNTTVLAAMRAVPRHEFVPRENQTYSYEDHPMPIGYDQTISQPYIVAAMTEALQLSPDDTVLEIGTGSGYQAAVLAEIVSTVYSIEIVKELAQRAERDLIRLGYTNVVVRHGDGYAGWKEHAPFNAIIVTCAPDNIPQPLIDQLAEGGRIVIPVGDRFSQQLIRLTRKNGKIEREHLMGVIFVPMTGKARQ